SFATATRVNSRPTTLIVGATRGLGAALAYPHAGHTVYATARAASPPTSLCRFARHNGEERRVSGGERH
ncbi:hypothetical protein C8R45DRAFT_1217228, partial [Mycena sanguinolenta]